MDVFTVDGSGFCASGNVCREAGGAKGSQALTEHQAVLGWLCRCAAICNEAHLNIASGFPDSDHYERMGEPTEAALLVLVEKLGLFSDEQIASKANTKRSVAHPTPFWYVFPVVRAGLKCKNRIRSLQQRQDCR